MFAAPSGLGYPRIMTAVRALMDRMVEKGWRHGGASTEAAVVALEREFDLTLPADYREFLVAAGGGEAQSPEAYTGLWPVSIIAPFNRRYRIPWNFPGLFGIGNDGFLVYVLDYREGGPVIASLGLSSSVWEDVVVETDTFTQWLERRLP